MLQWWARSGFGFTPRGVQGFLDFFIEYLIKSYIFCICGWEECRHLTLQWIHLLPSCQDRFPNKGKNEGKWVGSRESLAYLYFYPVFWPWISNSPRISQDALWVMKKRAINKVRCNGEMNPPSKIRCHVAGEIPRQYLAKHDANRKQYQTDSQ